MVYLSNHVLVMLLKLHNTILEFLNDGLFFTSFFTNTCFKLLLLLSNAFVVSIFLLFESLLTLFCLHFVERFALDKLFLVTLTELNKFCLFFCLLFLEFIIMVCFYFGNFFIALFRNSLFVSFKDFDSF